MMQHDWGSGQGERFRLGRRLESTSSGEVFESTHPLARGPCAIKVLRPELANRPEAMQAFAAEVSAVTALRHPNILPVIEIANLPEGQPVVVTERLEGRTLAERLEEQGTIPLGQVVEIVKAAAAGLQAAHDLGILHGELNPRNVFLARGAGYPQGVVKLLDFGVSALRPVDAVASLPMESIRYLAPEQAAGRADELDGRTDQFALALLAYRMLCGTDAFTADESALSLLYEIVHREPSLELLRDVHPELEAVLRRGLANNPRGRYETIVAFARALAAAVGENTGVVVRPTPPPGLAVPRPTPAAPPPAARPIPAEDPDPLLTHPFFNQDQEPVWPRPRRRIVYMRPPRRRGSAVLWVLLLAIAALGGAMGLGWRPPLAWRQTPLWHELRLPWAAPPGGEEPAPTRRPAAN
jgi:serine/threonine-protein kinase